MLLSNCGMSCFAMSWHVADSQECWENALVKGEILVLANSHACQPYFTITNITNRKYVRYHHTNNHWLNNGLMLVLLVIRVASMVFKIFAI